MSRLSSYRRSGMPGLPVLLLCLAAILAGRAPVRGESSTARQREENRRKIISMTETERARLKDNYDRFRKLSPEDQQRLRRLDQELKEDDRDRQGELRRTLKDYITWLEPLSPGEREDLRRESDPNQRAAMVRTMIKAEQDRADFRTRRGQRRALSPGDLDKVLGVLEGHLRQRGTRQAKAVDALQSKSGLERHGGVLELTFSRDRSERGAFPAPIPPDVINEMIAQISNPDFQKWVQDESPIRTTMRLFMLIREGVMAEFDSLKPSEETLIAFFEELKPSQQQEIMRLPVEWQQRRILHLYMEKHPSEFPGVPRFDRMFGDFQFDRERFRGWGGPGRGPQEGGEGPKRQRRLDEKSEGRGGPPGEPRRGRNGPPPQ